MKKVTINPVNEFLSLVRYGPPVLVLRHTEKNSSAVDVSMRGKETPSAAKKNEIEELLNSIFPPHCWDDEDDMWQMTVSSTPATRQDVIKLKQMFDTRLQETAARETGLCTTRREIYTQCFDEIIRQVIISCSERGLMLLQVRDEIAITMKAYETMFASSVAFGVRKVLKEYEDKEKIRKRIKSLMADMEVLKEIIADLKIKREEHDQRFSEIRMEMVKNYKEKLAAAKKKKAETKARLEALVVPKK